MTEREAAIVTAYTGILIGNIVAFHRYAEELMQGGIFSHEFANKELMEEIKNRSKDDFLNIEITPND